MHHYPFHIKDYQCDTVHLSNEADLCYRRLLDFYYLGEAPLANDKRSLSVRLRVAEQTLSEVLAEFFIECEEGFRHVRCDAEIERYQAKVNQTKQAGKLGGARKHEVLKANAKRTLGKRQASATNQEPITKNQEPRTNCLSDKEFIPDETAKRIANELGLNLAAEVTQFLDHHASRGTKLKDWQAGLRTWLRNSIKFSGKSAPDKKPVGGHYMVNSL